MRKIGLEMEFAPSATVYGAYAAEDVGNHISRSGYRLSSHLEHSGVEIKFYNPATTLKEFSTWLAEILDTAATVGLETSESRFNPETGAPRGSNYGCHIHIETPLELRRQQRYWNYLFKREPWILALTSPCRRCKSTYNLPSNYLHWLRYDQTMYVGKLPAFAGFVFRPQNDGISVANPKASTLPISDRAKAICERPLCTVWDIMCRDEGFVREITKGSIWDHTILHTYSDVTAGHPRDFCFQNGKNQKPTTEFRIFDTRFEPFVTRTYAFFCQGLVNSILEHGIPEIPDEKLIPDPEKSNAELIGELCHELKLSKTLTKHAMEVADMNE